MHLGDFSKSERLRTAAMLAPLDYRGELLARASALCPFNLKVWTARVDHINMATARGHDPDVEAWVGRTAAELAASWLGRQNTVISKGRPVKTSDDACDFICRQMAAGCRLNVLVS